jgi:hypothetical protein
MNTNSINNYDSFLIDLANEMNQKPNEKREIVLKAINNTNCPYLKDKIKQIKSDDSFN